MFYKYTLCLWISKWPQYLTFRFYFPLLHADKELKHQAVKTLKHTERDPKRPFLARNRPSTELP